MTFYITKGQAYLMDTGRIWIHTLQHLNPHPMGNRQTPQDLTILEAKPISLLILRIDTRVMMDPTPNQVAQAALAAPTDQEDQEDQVVLAVLEVPEVLAVPMDQEDWADPTIMPPMSKNFYENS
ncbi:hypothetical protein ARMGADRAFT_1093154 [Armillaria gallica]|uniref:Uncharacterized protein n=1 Tax=Armillaria gallica TaxID=47427 RepID=A0A2H3CTH7_ARMGA|nr:hypothetical protein ARMGADRAFT_1093154 [Armillaria gallica]